MQKNISPFFLVIFALFFVFLLSNTQQVLAAPTLGGLDKTVEKVDAFKNQPIDTNSFLQTKAGQVIGVVLSFVGVIFFGLMIYAGILWMTAQGNDQQVAKAKGILVSSIIGLIIVFAAYAITSFIGTNLINPSE